MEMRQRNVGSVMCLDLEGRLVLCDEENLLRDKVNELLSRGCLEILLNLREVTQIDTTGLSALIAVKLAVDRRKGRVRLINLPARIHSMLVLTRLITLFDVIESEADAVASSVLEASAAADPPSRA